MMKCNPSSKNRTGRATTTRCRAAAAGSVCRPSTTNAPGRFTNGSSGRGRAIAVFFLSAAITTPALSDTEGEPPAKPELGGEWAGTWASSTANTEGELAIELRQDGTSLKGQGRLITSSEATSGCFNEFEVSGLVSGDRMNLVIASPKGDTANVILRVDSLPLAGEFNVVSGSCQGNSGELSLNRASVTAGAETGAPAGVGAALTSSQPGETQSGDSPDAVSEQTGSESTGKSTADDFDETIDKDAYVLKGANIRKGPGTDHDKVRVLSRGSDIHVRGKKGDWYAITAQADNETVSAWIYAPLVTFDREEVAHGDGGQDSAWDEPSKTIRYSDGSELKYAGYAEEFLDVRQLFAGGRLNAIEDYYREKKRKREGQARKRETQRKTMTGRVPEMTDGGVKTQSQTPAYARPGLLHWLERGTLSITQGDYENAVDHFSTAERMLSKRQDRSKVASFFHNVSETIGEVVVGNEEIGEYEGEGFEKVLMLNYKSIAYLLRGERKAYNVTRRSIDRQKMEKRKFQEKLEETQEKLENKDESDSGFEEVADLQLPGAYDKSKKKALSVPSAYVNPFGYYVAGMVQEYESYSDWSLRENARISYEKALELNPDSEVIQEAVEDMSSSPPSERNLLHVVVGDGWVPEKRVLEYQIRVANGAIPLKLPIYVPVENSVDRIEVRSPGGRRLSTLSPVADIEAICLRHQKDQEPMLKLRAFTAVITSAVFRGVANQQTDSPFVNAIFKLLNKSRDELRAPDTRSWLSLPATMQAARVYVPKGMESIQLVSYSANGTKQASKTVEIAPDSHSFVYARSLNELMYTHSGKIPKWH